MSTEPVMVRFFASMEMSASSEPFSEFEVRNSRLAGLPCGTWKVPTPARIVAAKSVRVPLSSASV